MGIKKTQRAIDSWIRGEGNKLLIEELQFLMKIWYAWSVKENDFRTGEETYGYSNPEEIKSNMIYISDRWKCAFRVKWIIDGLAKGVL